MKILISGNHAVVSQTLALYSLIRKSGPVTRQFLCQQLALPATTISRDLDRLIQASLISESGLADSSGGRRPILYQTVGSAFYLFGLDLAADPAQLVLADLHLQVVSASQLSGLASLEPEKQAALVTDVCTAMLDQYKISPAKMLGLGVSLPETAGIEPDFTAMIGLVASSLHIAVMEVGSHKTLRYFARWRPENLPGCGFLALSAGRQVQLALMLNINSLNDCSEAGWSGQTIVPAPEKFSDSDYGAALDQLATQPSLLQRFQRAKDDPGLTWTDFCQAVQAGKRKSSQILQEAAAAMAIAVFNASVLTGCDSLLLDGSLWQEVPEAIKALQDKLAKIASTDRPMPEIKVIMPDIRQRAIGSAALVLDHYLGDYL